MPRIDNETVGPVAQSPAQEVRAPSPKKRKRVEESDNNDLYGKLPPEVRHEIMKKLPPKALVSLMATSKTARTEALEFSKTDEGKMKSIPYLLNLLITGKVTLKECDSDIIDVLRRRFNNVSNLESLKLACGTKRMLEVQGRYPFSSQRDMSNVMNLIFSHKFRDTGFAESQALFFVEQLRQNCSRLENIKLRNMSNTIDHRLLNNLIKLNGLRFIDLSDCLMIPEAFSFDSLDQRVVQSISGYPLDPNNRVSDLEKIPQNLKSIRIGLQSPPTEKDWQMIRDKLGKDSQLKIRNNSMSVRDTPPIRADQIPEDLRPYVTSYQWVEGEDIEHILRILPQLKELTVNRDVGHKPPAETMGIPEDIDQGIQQALLSKGIQLRIGDTNNDEVYVKNEDGTAFLLADDDNTLFI